MEFLGTGGHHGNVPAELVAAANEALLRVGRVDVKRSESVEAAEARAAASSSLEKEIDEAIAADPEMQARAGMKLSDAGYDSGLGTWDTSLRTKWNTAQGGHMEAKGVKFVRDLALVNMENMDLALALTLCDDTKTGRQAARRKLWNWKGAAAALVGVDDIGEMPKRRKPKDVAEPKEKKQRR